jgi:hypothetical protein
MNTNISVNDVKNKITNNLLILNENTKKYRQQFFNLVNNNKPLVFIIIGLILFSLITYRLTPIPREMIVKRTLSNYAFSSNLDSIYKVLTDNSIYYQSTNYVNSSVLFNKVGQQDKDLWLTLSDFYIASSSKSYLLMNKYYDYCSYESIKYIIYAGPRFIELDIFRKSFNEDDNIPVVTNGVELGEWKLCLNDLCLAKCLKIINDLALDDKISSANENPFILYLNIHINSELSENANKNIYDKHGDFRFFNAIATMIDNNISSSYLLKSEHNSYNEFQYLKPTGSSNVNHNTPLHLVNIYELKNKLIIMSNVTGSCSNLGDYINFVCPQDSTKNQYTRNIKNFNNGEIKGVYDIDALRNNNKNQLSYVYEESDKNALSNYSSGHGFMLGCQIQSMYYQSNDVNFQNYLGQTWSSTELYGKQQNKGPLIGNFKKCSFILKPAKLRNTYEELSKFTISSI